MSSQAKTKFLFRNRWIIAAALFFVLWKSFLVFTQWNDRLVPPVPDDSYVYILHLDSSLNCPNLVSCHDKVVNLETYSGFDHLSYRVFFGALGKIFHLDVIETYRASFYLGIILLVPALIYFLSVLSGHNKKLTAFLLMIAALYNGAGSYHGFYWVVPSFFVLTLFFLAFALVNDEKARRPYLFLSCIAFLSVTTHILSIYFLTLFPIYFGFLWIIGKKIDFPALKKALYYALACLCIYMPVSFYYSHVSYGNPYGPATALLTEASRIDTVLDKAQENTPSKTYQLPEVKISTLLPSLEKVRISYFNWIFPSVIGVIAFVGCLSILFFAHQYRILSLYFSGLAFVLVSTLHPDGERALLFLWPVTFLVYGYALWFAPLVFKKNASSKVLSFLRITTLLAFFFFVLINASYSYLWNVYISQARNYLVTEKLLDSLITIGRERQGPVFYSPDVQFLDLRLWLYNKDEKPLKAVTFDEANYFVEGRKTDDTETLVYQSIFSDFFHLVSRFLFFNRQEVNVGKVTSQEASKNLQLIEEKDEIRIYKIIR